jgi:biotin operon repressor
MDRKALTDWVNQLNKLGLAKKISPVQKTGELAKAFVLAVKAVPNEKESELGDELIDYYNELVTELEGANEVKTEEKEEVVEKKDKAAPRKKAAETKPAAKKEPAKKEPVKAAAKPAAKKTNGEVPQSAKIETCLKKGTMTAEKIAESTGAKLARVKKHIYALKKKGVTVTEDEKGKLTMEE